MTRVVVTDYNFSDLEIERDVLEPVDAEVIGADAATPTRT